MSRSRQAEHHLRAFGMSGLLISEELRKVEDRFNISLGREAAGQRGAHLGAYPQFEAAIQAEATGMSQHYELFYCLEKSIRKLIAETLVDAEPGNWWESQRVPDKIRADVDTRIQRELDSGVTRRSDDAIDYTTFGELSVIITNNWDLFETVFNSRRGVERVMASLNMLRGPIAHCCLITDDEIDRLHLTVRDWFRIMG